MDYKTLYEKTSPNKLFFKVAVPGVIGMLVSSLYQIIDGAFIGKVLGSSAFAALNLVMPLVIVNFSIADLIGVGSAVPIAIKLGEKKEHEASNVFTSACLLIVASGIALGAVFYAFAPDFIRLIGGDEELVELGAQYLRVYAVCSPFTTIVFAVDNYLRICGKVRYSMIVNILMLVIGTVLEFLFLVVFRFGIWGAALATCLGMTVCTVIAFVPFLSGKAQLRFVKPRIDGKTLWIILKNGSPSFLNNIAGRITSIAINVFLLRFGGATAVSAYGVLMYAEGFILPMLYGICDSLQPAVGYNYGAKNYSRIYAIERRCFGASALISILMTAVMIFANGAIVGIFVKADDAALVTMSLHALTLFALAYLTRWISLAAQSYFSAIGKAGYATVISVSLALFFPIVALFSLLPLELEGLWLNMPVACLMSAVLSVILMIYYHKKVGKQKKKD